MKRTKALEASIDNSLAILDAIRKAMYTLIDIPSNFVLREGNDADRTRLEADRIRLEADRNRLFDGLVAVFRGEIGEQTRAQFVPFAFESVVLGIFQYLSRFKESIRQDKSVDSDDGDEQKNEAIPTLEKDQNLILFVGVEYIKVFSVITDSPTTDTDSPAVSLEVKKVSRKLMSKELKKLSSDVDMVKKELKKLILGSDFRGHLLELSEGLKKRGMIEQNGLLELRKKRISQINALYQGNNPVALISEFLEKFPEKKVDGHRIFLVVLDKVLKGISQVLCKAMPIRLLSVLNHCLHEGIFLYSAPISAFYSLPQIKIGSAVTNALNSNDHASCLKVLRRINAMIEDFDQVSSNRDLLHKNIWDQYDALKEDVDFLRGQAQLLHNKIDELEIKKEVTVALDSNVSAKCLKVLRFIHAMIEDLSQGNSNSSPQNLQERYHIFKGLVEILESQAKLLDDKVSALAVEVEVEVDRSATLSA